MRYLLGIIFALALALPASAATFEVSGWIPYWREEEGAAEAMRNLGQLTEINPFGYIVQSDGTLVDAMGIADEPWKSLIAEAKKKKVRVIPTVMWSDADAMHRILSDQTARIALEDEITALAVREGFDGIDIDFEGKYAETKDFYSTFLRGLYQRMGKKWVMCTIEPRTPLDARYTGQPPAGAGIYANDFVQINKYCDRVRVMTYDQGTIDVQLNAKALSSPYIPLADPLWVEKVIKQTAQTISKHKLVIGIPTYGYEYEMTPLTQSGFRYERQWSFNPNYATDLMNRLGLKAQRNMAGELSVSYLPAITPPNPESTLPNALPFSDQAGPAAVAAATLPIRVLWWSDAVAIKQKVDLAKKLGVRGVAVFKIDGGADQAMWSSLRQVR
jgi:spore germination protein YaaH